jgi:hypothetical protein
MSRLSVCPLAVTVAWLGAIVAFFLWGCGTPAYGQSADINNGIVRIGVDKFAFQPISAIQAPLASAGGVTSLGLRYMPTNNEAVPLGNAAKGWGVGDAISSDWGGGASSVFGTTALTLVSFTSTASTAVSKVTAGSTPTFEVTHDFHPTANPNVYEVSVTVKNIRTAPVNARYRWVVDFDVEPAVPFGFFTIKGATAPTVINFTRGLSNPDFNPNPLVPPTAPSGDVLNTGPTDPYVNLTIDLGALAPGASTTILTYYGATADMASALTVLATMGINVYTLAQPNAAGTPNTFFYGYKAPGGPGVTITQSGGSTSVTEGGSTDTYTVVLNTAPSANVTITINPGSQVNVAPATLTFTTANWNTAQTVTVTAIDDALAEGPHVGTITHTAASTDAAYNGIAVASVTPNIADNDAGTPAPSPGGNNEGGIASDGGEAGWRSARVPILAGPFCDSREMKVFNVAHRQRTQAEQDTPGWSLAVTATILALIGLLAVARIIGSSVF